MEWHRQVWERSSRPTRQDTYNLWNDTNKSGKGPVQRLETLATYICVKDGTIQEGNYSRETHMCKRWNHTVQTGKDTVLEWHISAKDGNTQQTLGRIKYPRNNLQLACLWKMELHSKDWEGHSTREALTSVWKMEPHRKDWEGHSTVETLDLCERWNHTAKTGKVS